MPTPAQNQAYWRARLANQGSISKTPSTIGGIIEDGLRKVARKTGASERASARFAKRAMSFANDATPVGNVTGAEQGAKQTYRGITKGEAGTTAAGIASLLLSVAPLPGGVKKPAKRGIAELIRDETGAIRAWHGSPHDFDRFDMSKIGTGEGNQAYGRGLYFSEHPSVAGSYVQPRGAEPLDVPPEVTDRLRSLLKADDYLGFDTFGEAIHAVRSNPIDFDRVWEVSDAPAIKDALRAYDDVRWPQGKRPRLYETDINAEPEHFYDLDAGPRISEAEAQRQGFKGFRFLDKGSRGSGNGTSNYVVFDDSLIDILNKF